MPKLAQAPAPNRTIREQLADDELFQRETKAKETKFDKPIRVEQEGDRLIIPRKMRPEKAIEAVKKWVDAESQIVAVNEEIPGIPIDAAHALQLAIRYEYGEVELKGTFFEDPTFISVPTSAKGDHVEVYVGQMTLPGLDGCLIKTHMDNDGARLLLQGNVKKKDMPLLKQLIETARRFSHEQSLFKGKAFTVSLGEVLPDGRPKPIIPEFWDVESVRELIINADTEALLQATLWTPIEMADMVRKMGTPIKRGVLLYGIFGTGKTLSAYNTAQKAVRNDFTFCYMKNVSLLAQGIEFISKNLLPAVLFCEDTEGAFDDPAKVKMIQNTMDGVDSKSRELIVVLTTNFVAKLPPSIMRPGRLDTIIPLNPPDAPTAARLVVHYAGELLDTSADMDEIGMAIAGNIPASIREIVERSKLFALTRTKSNDFKINHLDIVGAAKGMEAHMLMLRDGVLMPPSPLEIFGGAMGAEIGQAIRDSTKAMVDGSAYAKDGIKKDTVQ